MNEVSNNFRLVPRSEVEADHYFRATRQFPELLNSLRGVERNQKLLGRDMTTTRRFANQDGKMKTRSPLQLKSTHKLDKLTGSCLTSLNSMNSMRNVLMSERARARHERANERLSSTTAQADALKTPLERANIKLTKKSVSFSSSGNFNVLAGFQGSPLTIDELSVQLKRCLNINLKRDELEAVFASMDLDDSGDIDGVEFTRYFFKLGSDRIAERRKKEQEIIDAREKAELEAIEAERTRRLEWENAQISYDITPEIEHEALSKLSSRAYLFDQNHFIDQLLVRDFKSHLSPYQFVHQLQESFELYLTRTEYGALVKHFTSHPHSLHCIDGERFVKEFYSMQRVELVKAKIIAQEKKILRQKVNERGQFVEIFTNLGR